MGTVFGWEPLLWAFRVMLLVFVFFMGYLGFLYGARFLRPRHAWRLVTAELPIFRNVGATAKVLGQELSANATLDERQDEQIQNILSLMDDFDQRIRSLTTSVELLRKEGNDDQG